MKPIRVLITGGAGYIGSHAALRLAERGYRLVILDDLSTGHREAVIHGDFIQGDVGDMALVDRILEEYRIDVVMHFAAKTVVPESVKFPLEYYDYNMARTRNLLECCLRKNVLKFVFSSTAAVYGLPPDGIASEQTATNPINPYGSSKLMCERMLLDTYASNGLRHVTLRYFNVAGSDPRGRIGQMKRNCTLLTKVACEAAVGTREHVTIFGTDYDTPDGTGIRDYVHVDDIARAHVDALEYLLAGGHSETVNCGYGHGYSVRQVLDGIQEIHGSPIDIREAPRRAGDPPILVSQASKIGKVLGWKPIHDNLETILRSALEWEYHLVSYEPPHAPVSLVEKEVFQQDVRRIS